MSEKAEEYPVIWLQLGTCTGCSVSVLNSVSPSIKNVLIDEVIPGKHISLRYHATVMAGAGDQVIEEMERTAEQNPGAYILVVEGSVLTGENGAYGAIGEKDEKPIAMTSWLESLGSKALAVVCLGTCAAFGGIPAGNPNPSNAMGVRQFFKEKGIATPLVNVPGCPPHPDWFVGTVASVLLNGLPSAGQLDENCRPKSFYGQLVHENCPRRAYFDEGKFAKKFGEPGCLYELGCKGPLTYADCPIRHWNHGVNWCIGAGSPCIGCCEPGFPDLMAPFYVKTADVELPKIGARQ